MHAFVFILMYNTVISIVLSNCRLLLNTSFHRLQEHLARESSQKPQQSQQTPEQSIKEVTDKMAAASAGHGWGWGWSVDSLLSTASAGISNITSQVSQVYTFKY